MADLVVTAGEDLGPLSVKVVAAGGERPTDERILLCSARREATIRGLAPYGDYVVIGTRPTGDTLIERVKLGKALGHVNFRPQGRSPHEFLTQAAERGLVPSLPPEVPLNEDSKIESLPSMRGERLFGAAGSAGRALKVLLTQNFLARSHRLIEHFLPDEVFGEPGWPQDKPKACALHQWALADRRWHLLAEPISYELRPDYFQVFVTGGWKSKARAFALLDEDGFGPVVIAPPFREGLDITFLADGLVVEDAAERVANPSAIRVPVAVAMPRDPGLADLLSGLTAPSLPEAQQLWAQEAGHRFGGEDHALDVVLHKYKDPAAAVLGAHFLARFSPTKAPVRWLENLSRLLPNVADAPTLLAWRLIAEGSTGERHVSRREIRGILRDAQHRPCCFFARTRALLTTASRLYGPKPRQRSVEHTERPRLPSPGDFLNVAAEAGGLEAFWGTSPSSPGRPATAQGRLRKDIVIHLDGRSFKP